LPPSLNLSSEKLDRNGAYLLEDGQSITMWIGRGINPQFLQQVFGISTIDGVDTTKASNIIDEFVSKSITVEDSSHGQ
jgi:protein transport protein SEC24